MFFDLWVGGLAEPLTGRTLNSREIISQVTLRARQYGYQGIAQGDRVFLHYGNNLEFFLDLMALWHLGACIVPIDSRLTEFEVKNFARAVAPRFAMADFHTVPATVAGLQATGLKIIHTEALDVNKSLPSPVVPFFSKLRLDDEALILFTSGSTGIPKGVVHTHRSLRSRWIALRESLGLSAYGKTLCFLPTHFGHGLICNCLFPWLSGQDLFIAPPFSAEVLLQLGRLIDEHKITFVSSVPSMWGLILKASRPPQGHTLRRIHCGSAPLTAHLWTQIQEWGDIKEVFNTYGITETGSWVAGTTLDEFLPEDGLIGVGWGAIIKILKGLEPELLCDIAAQCKPDETGYIWINTPALMKGYYGQPELTDQVVSGGWFSTRDIGLFDERGRLYLKGREGEEINKGGTKIYPADIDAVVERFEHTREVCTFAIADPLYGQNVALAVVLKKDDPKTIAALHQWMKVQLAEFKMPARWYVMDALPKNSRGKVGRRAVQESCAKKIPLDLATVLRK